MNRMPMPALMTLALAAGLLAFLAGPAAAGTHYAFVKFEANGTTVTGNTDITNIGGETLDRAEWIQCKRVTYGLKRDIGTGARVSGHTHYDRIEFDMPQGPATPVFRAGTRQTMTVTVNYFANAAGTGKPVMQVKRAGVLVASTPAGDGRVTLTVDLEKPVDAATADRAKALTAERAAPARAE